MLIPVSKDVILSELCGARSILDKWIKQINGGLPVIDVTGTPEDLRDLLAELCGELVLVGNKCHSLSDVLSHTE